MPLLIVIFRHHSLNPANISISSDHKFPRDKYILVFESFFCDNVCDAMEGIMNKDLRDLTPKEIEEWVIENGQQRFRADQVLEWLYRRFVTSINDMDNLPAALRR